MCGFVATLGAVGPTEQSYRQRLVASTRRLRHRGPDDEAFYFSSEFSAGFRRLKIIDLTRDGRQPMSDTTGRYWIVFNGEIYNYRELRAELQRAGWSFRSHSDTEVLLTSYLAWDEGCLSRLNGMFAFLIWDRAERRVFGARDRFGEKPLFYVQDGDAIHFASEIKALMPLLGRVPKPHPDAMRKYVEDRLTDFCDQTFFEGIKSLEPAHRLAVTHGRMTTRPYWELSESPAGPHRDVVAEFRELLLDSVRLRMRSDVPVGTCLSGGLDSGAIVSAIPHVLESSMPYSAKSFTASYPEFDERAEVAAVNLAGGAIGHECVPRPQGFSSLEEMLWQHDEPFHSFAAFASYEVMRLAKQEGVIVLLNGQGADETLAGYPKYLAAYLRDLIRSFHWKSAAAAACGGTDLTGLAASELLQKAVRNMARDQLSRVPGLHRLKRAIRSEEAVSAMGLTPEMRRQCDQQPLAVRPSSRSSSVLRTALQHSMKVSNLPLYLRVEDRNSMAHSLESRLPFLDHRLVEFAYQLPVQWLMKTGLNKYLLRESMRGILPELVRSRRGKFGFPIPTEQWIYSDLRSQTLDLLGSREFVERGEFDASRLREQFLRESGDWSPTAPSAAYECNRWFRLLSLELWRRSLPRYAATESPSEPGPECIVNAGSSPTQPAVLG